MYNWEQTSDFITIRIPVSNNTKNKNINITVNPDNISILINDQIICKGNLYNRIYKDFSWYFDYNNENKLLYVELEKIDKNFETANWPRLFEDDNKIKCDNDTIYTKIHELPKQYSDETMSFFK